MRSILLIVRQMRPTDSPIPRRRRRFAKSTFVNLSAFGTFASPSHWVLMLVPTRHVLVRAEGCGSAPNVRSLLHGEASSVPPGSRRGSCGCNGALGRDHASWCSGGSSDRSRWDASGGWAGSNGSRARRSTGRDLGCNIRRDSGLLRRGGSARHGFCTVFAVPVLGPDGRVRCRSGLEGRPNSPVPPIRRFAILDGTRCGLV